MDWHYTAKEKNITSIDQVRTGLPYHETMPVDEQWNAEFKAKEISLLITTK